MKFIKLIPIIIQLFLLISCGDDNVEVGVITVSQKDFIKIKKHIINDTQKVIWSSMYAEGYHRYYNNKTIRTTYVPTEKSFKVANAPWDEFIIIESRNDKVSYQLTLRNNHVIVYDNSGYYYKNQHSLKQSQKTLDIIIAKILREIKNHS